MDKRYNQVAMVGHSNVGKSSLINSLLYGSMVPHFAKEIVRNVTQDLFLLALQC